VFLLENSAEVSSRTDLNCMHPYIKIVENNWGVRQKYFTLAIETLRHVSTHATTTAFAVRHHRQNLAVTRLTLVVFGCVYFHARHSVTGIVERQRRGNGRTRRFLVATVTETANAVTLLLWRAWKHALSLKNSRSITLTSQWLKCTKMSSSIDLSSWKEANISIVFRWKFV